MDGPNMTPIRRSRLRFHFSLTQCYLEHARCAFTTLYTASGRALTPSSLRRNKNRISGVLFSLTSQTIIYSFMAVEAFANYHFYQIWRKREAQEFSAIRFRDHFGDVPRFQDLQYSDVRELAKRLKIICHLLGYPPVHEKHPRLWQQFRILLEDARHFLIHPFPDPARVQGVFDTILTRTTTGTYVSAAEGVIGHFYEQGKAEPPIWLHQNYLMRSRGVELLPQSKRKKGLSSRLNPNPDAGVPV